ncbi:MAG: hypothetical protein VXZ96_16555 [Myxococcota bacterium]|nr:hypothetical protein [Myxococcota bacterium]MEC8381944.1 hypothetical protein [Myxococcota bacterium]
MKKATVRIIALLSSFGLSACTVNQIDAPYGSQVVLSSGDVTLAWSEEANEFDLAGTLLYFDVMVVNSDNVPLENVKVEISSSFSGVYLIPQEAVQLVSYPGLPANVQSTDDVKDACSDDNGNYILAEDWCAWYWDTSTQQFYQFAGTYANAFSYSDTAGYYWYAPTLMSGQTDGRGLLRVYSMVDMMPVSDLEGFGDVQILASIGVDSESFDISAGE